MIKTQRKMSVLVGNRTILAMVKIFFNQVQLSPHLPCGLKVHYDIWNGHTELSWWKIPSK